MRISTLKTTVNFAYLANEEYFGMDCSLDAVRLPNPWLNRSEDPVLNPRRIGAFPFETTSTSVMRTQASIRLIQKYLAIIGSSLSATGSRRCLFKPSQRKIAYVKEKCAIVKAMFQCTTAFTHTLCEVPSYLRYFQIPKIIQTFSILVEKLV